MNALGRAWFLVLAACVLCGRPTRAEELPDRCEHVAIIVNQANRTPDPDLVELVELFTLREQFWKDGRRVVLILPVPGTTARIILLEKAYRRSESELRKDWARRLFAGEIPALPSVARSIEAAASFVKQSTGAISAVPASAIPQGVRVLVISGKRPGEKGYPLAAPANP